MIRTVLDTNVLFSAAFKDSGTPARILDLAVRGIITPCVSDAVMAEYRDVLGRPVMLPHAPRTKKLLDLMEVFAVHVSPDQKLSLCSDEDDNRFLECAVFAEAEYLATGNTRHFPKRFTPVAIVTPRQLLERLIAAGLA